MRKIFLLNALLLLCVCSLSAQQTTNERSEWLQMLDKIARPVFYNLANDELKEKMPVEISPVSDNPKGRIADQYLEALGRTLSGIAPWLQSDGGSAEETKLRAQYRTWAIKAIANATDSTKKDYMVWDKGGQPVVDASYLALGLIRCPWLWEHLDDAVKNNVVHCLTLTRKIIPVYSNWILFSGMIEAFFCKYGYDYEPLRIEYGVREFMQHWYVGDGMFSDGMNFHLDYYNSYVIQPFLKEIIDIVNAKTGRYKWEQQRLAAINNRYSQIQERSINSDGSFPAFGRSIVYRCGAFHHLANMALHEQLPKNLSAGQVREALNAVMKKTLTAQGTFDKNGWLVIGLDGNQPGQADVYNTQGSLYLCTEIFLPLGLSPGAPFWSEPAKDWSEKAIWNEEDYSGDHALDLR
ncbi:hypothetical protein A9P82_14465 [Arachidicoccus ginsenosidimutans]|uniref:DUF2264 domain-containing protein n=1 Tax=Arachidicoccus sp. BS20 TaxID=1850526 RepID=UPI0007F11329|nr:DUF2264 domain-containing protein [Arachidicoccus sp. BS20]ANI90803.1 hypothetical protein A9P82_14465 [Arachidicoccus sp. BS20]